MDKINGPYVYADGRKFVTVNKQRKNLSRYLMEQKLERILATDEHVHHLDGDRANDSLDNLVVLSVAEHKKLHPVHWISYVCTECGKEFTRRKGGATPSYCSLGCKGVAQSRNALVLLTCCTCGKRFFRKRGIMERDSHKGVLNTYCSSSCFESRWRSIDIQSQDEL